MRTPAPPKEPVLSRRPKHLAPTAPSSSPATGALALSPRNRSRLLLLLAVTCGALLLAAPLAIVFSSGSPQAGGDRSPNGVFRGGTDGGTGRGGGAVASVTTAASQTAAPAGGGQAAGVSPAAAAGAVNGGGGGAVPAGGGGTAAQPGTAAGVPAPAAGQQPAAQQPAAQRPVAQQPAQPVQQPPAQPQPVQQPPAQQPSSPQQDANGYPCPCHVVNGVLTSLTAPLPTLPSSPLG